MLAGGPQAVQLATPAGTVRCDAFGFGAIRVAASPGGSATVAVRAAGAHAPVAVPAGMTLTHER